MTTKLAVPNQPLTPEELALIEVIRHELEHRKFRSMDYMEQETKTSHWNVGRYIKEHLRFTA